MVEGQDLDSRAGSQGIHNDTSGGKSNLPVRGASPTVLHQRVGRMETGTIRLVCFVPDGKNSTLMATRGPEGVRMYGAGDLRGRKSRRHVKMSSGEDETKQIG
jgi:hypothetical protein